MPKENAILPLILKETIHFKKKLLIAKFSAIFFNLFFQLATVEAQILRPLGNQETQIS